ncbi:MAG: hypothetical protein R3C13_01305 [Hyphomonas sp.]|uniref:hypothetical protein n=1 Tax=Hyphomonas sp. TaxID=87 RepID=UPI003527CB64
MSDIFEEVDESIRQDKIESLWKQYRPFVYVGAALLIGSVALNEFVLRPAAEKAKAARAMELETATTQLTEGDFADAEASLRALAEGNTSLAPLASNFLAQTLYEGSGDAAGAEAALTAAGSADGTPFERLALLKAAYAKADTISLEELETLLGSLKEDNSAMGALARELVAAKVYASGDIARARTEFNRLKFDAAAPEGVQRRAEIALAAIPTPVADDTAPESTPESTPAPADETEATEETGQ